MPFIHIKIAGQTLAPGQTDALCRETTRLIADIMGKRREVTSVLVEPVAAGRWMIGGETVMRSVHMDVFITQGTNSAGQKAEMVAASNKMLRAALGALPEAVYVVIHENAADAWGYDGITQAARAAAVTTEVRAGRGR